MSARAVRPASAQTWLGEFDGADEKRWVAEIKSPLTDAEARELLRHLGRSLPEPAVDSLVSLLKRMANQRLSQVLLAKKPDCPTPRLRKRVEDELSNLLKEDAREWLSMLEQRATTECVPKSLLDHARKRLANPELRPIPEISDACDFFGEMEKITEPANKLRRELPRVISFYENNMSPTPYAQSLRHALRELDNALDRALPYIKFEQPSAKEQKRNYRTERKEWHGPAVVIADALVRAFKESELPVTTASRKTRLVATTRTALERLGYGEISDSAVASHIERIWSKFGWRNPEP